MDAKWEATVDDAELGSITRPNGTTVVTDAIGLLNMYEYHLSYHETTGSNGYLNNGLHWWTSTPYNKSIVRHVSDNGGVNTSAFSIMSGVRPSINLKSNVIITGGDGTKENPFQIELKR